MSLPAMSLGLMFRPSRKSGTGVHLKGANNLDISGLSFKDTLTLGGPLLSSFAQMGLENGLQTM